MADQLLAPGEIPLCLSAHVCFCQECSLVQLREVADPAFLFRDDYPYFSSVSAELRNHFSETAEELQKRLEKKSDVTIIEGASNDGYLIGLLKEKGYRVLGIEPAGGPAKKAIENGIPTRIEFFGSGVAEKLGLAP